MNSKPIDIPSPCIRNCCLDNNDVCLGCFRTVKEIMNWQQADELTRLDILNNAVKRREAYRQKSEVYRNLMM